MSSDTDGSGVWRRVGRMRDGMDGDTDGTRWLSYAELADARRISKRSAIRLTFRHRWPRQKGNDGTVRVAVPLSELDRKQEEKADTDDDIGDDIRDDVPVKSRLINALEAAIAELRARAEQDKGEISRERGRADAAEAELQLAREKMAELREARAAAITKADAAESRVDDLMAEIRELGKGRAEAQAKAELLQAEADRLRAEAERLRGEATITAMPAPGRRWRFWRRRGS
jgi:hypothetical protein